MCGESTELIPTAFLNVLSCLDNGSRHIHIRDDRRAQREIELGGNPCLKLIDHGDEIGFCILLCLPYHLHANVGLTSPTIRILLARHKAITRSGLHLTLSSQRSFSYNMWHDTESCSSQEEEVQPGSGTNSSGSAGRVNGSSIPSASSLPMLIFDRKKQQRRANRPGMSPL